MWQPVLMISGYFISVLGVAMLFPAALDIFYTNVNWSYFINSSIIAFFIGLSLFLSNQGKVRGINLRQAYLLTVISWFSVTILAAIPFVLYGTPFADALFEAASGISTTGATIYTDIEGLPRSILLWRSLLNGMGGIGIVIFAIAMLPFLGIGGMQIFQRENSDINEKFMPKISYIAKRIIIVYVTLLLACLFSLKLAGMNWFDALCHALSSIATGGFSTKNASIAAFKSPSIEWIITLFMFLSALPLTFYHSLLATRNIHSIRSTQVTTFTKVLIVYIAFMSIWLSYNGVYDFGTAVRQASFNIVSVVTTTGFASADFLEWGVFASTAFVIFGITGGCTGSTSGSIKIFRWQVIWTQLKRAMINTLEPNRVLPLKVGTAPISADVAGSVYILFIAFGLSVFALTLLVSLLGYDFITSFSAVVACMTNVGPGVIPSIGPSGNYAFFSDSVKYTLSFAMLLGRLEVMTILVIFTKNFWK
ncbi:MAG: TrkH family potassium uptake protein [Alphaproteobacteria bacterium]|nr:TrkH family potassium uptake protein [Alphaproteobacteria bacterium]